MGKMYIQYLGRLMKIELQSMYGKPMPTYSYAQESTEKGLTLLFKFFSFDGEVRAGQGKKPEVVCYDKGKNCSLFVQMWWSLIHQPSV